LTTSFFGIFRFFLRFLRKLLMPSNLQREKIVTFALPNSRFPGQTALFHPGPA
jgi:hypothetical protein